jgi:hypothetical protein
MDALERMFYRDAFPTCVVGTMCADGTEGRVSVRGDTRVDWHTDGSWSAHNLLADGAVIATCDDLAILHLHHGNRRVTIEEAESIFAGSST